jgi:hypothetical protein
MRFFKLFNIFPSSLLDIDGAAKRLVGNGRLFGIDFLRQVTDAHCAI